MSEGKPENENVILRVIAMSVEGSVLLYDRSLAWQRVVAEGAGNATSLCTLASSLGTLAHNMGEATQTIVAKTEDASPAPAPAPSNTPPPTSESANPAEGEAEKKESAPPTEGETASSTTTATTASPAPASQPSTTTTTTASAAAAAPGTKRVISVYFDYDAKVCGAAQRAKTRRVRRTARDENEMMPCVRLAIAQGQRAVLCVFHLAKPTPSMHMSGGEWSRNASTLANAVDDMICDAVVAFEKHYSEDLTRLAPRIEVCSKSDGAEVLSDDERSCFGKCMEEVIASACKEHSISLFLPA